MTTRFEFDKNAPEKDAGSAAEYGSRSEPARPDYSQARDAAAREDEEQDVLDRPRVELVGRDGNAFAILGACQKAARRAGWPPAKWNAVRDEMTAGDYSHLLATAAQNFDVS